MATVVYVVCALTSIACAWLLARSYRTSRSRLLLWSSLCFGWLAVNNVLLVVDLSVVADTDLRPLRSATALIGLSCLLYGLIFDTERRGP